MKVAVIGGRDLVLGFSLAGVKQLFLVNSSEEAESALNRCLHDEDLGIILIEEMYEEQLAASLEKVNRSRQIYPIIIQIPGSR